MPTILTGQMDLSSATEGVAVASNTDVASFTVNNTTDTASAFTATIDWGDGTTSAGTVVGSNGSFTVEGGHAYADEGSPTAAVTITHTADNAQLALLGTVSVADTDNLTGHGRTFTFAPNQPLTNVTVATFTDTNTGNVAGDFTANIDWGDGTVTTGTVSGSNGTFSILGSHTYAASGDNTVTVFMNDDFPDAAFASATSTAVSGFAGQIDATTTPEGTAINGTIASFADTTANLPASDYTATINWGDGTTTTGTVAGSNQSFSVQGTHIYADEGDFQATVSITRTTDNATIAPTGTIAVLEADLLTGTSKTIGGQPGVLISNAVVATFSDVNTANVAGDFTATIDWGDGTVSVGTVSGSGATFSVSGSHTYVAAGQDILSVTLTDDDPGTATATTNSTAFIGFAAGDVVLSDATEHVALPSNTQVATFTDGNFSDTAASFSSTIDWGDGITTAGTIVGSNGSFTVEGGHTYGDEGSFQPIVTITRTADNAQVVDNDGSVAVAENDALTPHGATVSGSPGQALSNVVVATFSDTDTIAQANDFTAAIDWGDGTTTAGTVSGGSGTFSVAGTHTYAANGHDTISVTLTDDAPGTATATATSAANIGLSGQVVLTSATERVALPSNTQVATFIDPNGADTAASFTSTINWGDGTTTAGTVSGASGSFTVSGGHTYADEGNFSAIATLTRTSDNQSGTGSGSIAVAEHDSLAGTGTTVTGTAHQALSNVAVATFTDTDTVAPASDFVGTIDWGDGTTTAGTVAGASGSFTVSGTHTYANSGQDTVTVTLADDAPGTATATTTTTATIAPGAVAKVKSDFNGDGDSDLVLQNAALNGNVMVDLMNGASVTSTYTVTNPGGPSWVVVADGDFNGDGKADFVVQNTSGAPDIWLMNGTTIASTVALPVPPASWHIISTGDFNNDGHPDILWQNTSGQPAIWLMNGTSVVSAVGLTTPPASWRVIGAGDFNGDGNSDILWQNADGTPGIWEMNGTSVISAVSLTAPPPQWKIVGTGDFNGDGHADILWINTNDNTPGIWEMNGTSIISSVALIAPPSSWVPIGTSDVNGDGHSDILWQNANTSQVGVWEMNGTSIMAAVAPTTPGTGWQLKNDGPIPSDQIAAGAGAMHLSAPDGAIGTGAAGGGAGPLATSGSLDPQAPNSQHPLHLGG
jgi:FG-GAP-like repeat